MKACEHCGYTFEHNPETCKSLVREKKTPKIHHFKGANKGPGPINVSRKTIVALADYLNGKRR